MKTITHPVTPINNADTELYYSEGVGDGGVAKLQKEYGFAMVSGLLRGFLRFFWVTEQFGGDGGVDGGYSGE